MPHRQAARKAEQLEAVRALVSDRLAPGDVDQAVRFVEDFYRHVPPGDTARHDPETLYGAALSALDFLRQRQPDEPGVRVLNPVYEQHGYHIEHTVLEIVTDDMPFLVDSVTAALTGLGMVVYLVIHPVLRVQREDGAVRLCDAESDGATRESFIHVQFAEQTDPDVLDRVRASVRTVLDEVRVAVDDWPAMTELARATAEGLRDTTAQAPPTDDPDMVGEMAHFLTWLCDNHFTFLGTRDYAFVETEAGPRADPEPGLGILRDPDVRVFGQLRDLETLPEDVQAYVLGPAPVLLTKTAMRSRVHRPVPMDAVVVKRFDADHRLAGLTLMVGLFTAEVYTNSAVSIPVVRRRVARVMALSGFAPRGHDGKRLLHIMETLPRDELIQSDEASLLEVALGILDLQERQRAALFLRMDEFQRFISCLVFIPRDRYDTTMRRTVQDILETRLHGRVETWSTQVDETPLARLHTILRTTPGTVPTPDTEDLEARIAAATRSWSDHLADALVAAKGEEQGLRLLRRHGAAFPASYRERHSAQAAVADIARIETALATGTLSLNLHRPVETPRSEVRFKVYQPSGAVPLSDMLPVLENMGFRVIGEVPFELRPSRGTVGDDDQPAPGTTTAATTVWLHDFAMTAASGAVVDLNRVRDPFQEAFRRVWTGDLENDGFNRLVIEAGLTWRQVTVLRAYARYLQQTRFIFSQSYIIQALATHPTISARLVALFEARFDPEPPEETTRTEADIEAAIAEGLDEVTNPDEDRILRRYHGLIKATLRTNFFQTTEAGAPKPWLSLKIDSRSVTDLPLPRPWVEVFVYSPRVEAIHLRGGKVARGGIRWSDRREDFRTEVLGLMKAQMVKNAVIVPVGSKGGFVVKRPPPADAGREAVQAEGIECYKTFMRGLLDITDNLKGEEVVPPPRVRRRDGDDPYLVVAADKGTATFSDIANAISAEYDFWLRDAFASGGSNGYDHKAMGITARGAWEAVKRHFREMGHDTQTADFTVIGVGDMSGDVFGNGMLLSRHIRLIGAFNHQHIFLDPDPDPAVSWEERKRLFDLPRSSWADYDHGLLSEGGQIYARRAKEVRLTPQIKDMLGIRQDVVTPTELIRALLRGPADLLWFGGIGTYVKASQESHIDAGDRANDAIRVDADDLRVKVIGEGANLGVTQRARVEFAGRGGRINTDAIDNSAGVDCSDHEVNIKILLDGIVEAGDLTEKQRNQLLGEMTDDVAALVLRDNYLQTQAISLMERGAAGILDHQHRLMRVLERSGRLDRAVEFLPGDDEIAERMAAGRGLTRPELAVLIPYGKLWIFDEVMGSDMPEDPMLNQTMAYYFPPAIQTRFRDRIGGHRLRREIIATYIANSMINRVGAAFVTEMMEKTGMRPADIARAYMAVREVYGLRALWDQIEALDGRVAAPVQMELLHTVNQLVARQTQWMLRHGTWPLDVTATVTELAPAVQTLSTNLDELATAETLEGARARMETWVEAGVPTPLAAGVACLMIMAAAGDIVRITAAHDLPMEGVARLYFAVGTRLGIGWLRRTAEKLETGGHWTKLAVSALTEEFYSHQRQIADRIIEHGRDLEDPDAAIAAWIETTPVTVDRAAQLIGELQGTSGGVDLAMLTVASRQFRAMAGV
jgi:glutamate dehydrogenase